MEQTRAWGRSPRSAFLRGWPSLRQSSRWTALGRTSRCPGRAGRGRGRTRWITSIINAVNGRIRAVEAAFSRDRENCSGACTRGARRPRPRRHRGGSWLLRAAGRVRAWRLWWTKWMPTWRGVIVRRSGDSTPLPRGAASGSGEE